MVSKRDDGNTEYGDRVTVRISSAHAVKLEKWANAIGLSRGDVIRVLLNQWFAHETSVVQGDKGLE